MNEIVTINNNKLPVVEYKGEPVVTFKMIDQVHEIPSGSSKRNFTRNKKRFIESRHFYKIGRDEYDTDLWECFGFSKFAATGILLTERGYLLISKTLTDDLAWEVQEQLIDGYFRVKIKKLTPAEQLLKSVQLTVEIEKKQKLLLLEQKQLEGRQVESETRLDRIEAQMKDDPGYFAITGYANLIGTTVDEDAAKSLGKAATKLSKELGISISKVRHGRWGLVNSYHESVLERVFRTLIPAKQEFGFKAKADA